MKNSFIKITLKGTKSYIVLLIILSAIYSRLVVYVPMFIQYILDGVIVGKEEVIPSFIRALFDTDTKMTKIIILVLNLIFVNLVIVMVNFIKNKINVKFNLKINRNVKENILKHIPKLQYDEFHNIDKSDVIQRVNNDAATYAEFFNSQINLFFDTIFIVVFAIIQTVKLNLAVGLFIVGMSFLIIVLSIWHYKITKPLVEDIVEMNQEIISKTTTSVQESKMLKIFNRKEKKNFEDLNQKCKKKEMTFAKIRAAYVITTHSIRNFKEPFILLWGGILVVKGELTLAQVSILLSFATKITNYIYNSVEKVSFINEFLVASKKLSHLMKYKEEIEDKPTVKLNGDITFKNVSIKIKNNILLKNLNFTIQQTQNVAIVGNNGTGKTVIAKTLIGFYEYTGEIYIGKQNIKEVSKKSVRDYIGVVLQDTFLFTDTIRNNINITNKIATSVMVVCFYGFMIVMIEYAIPSQNIKQIIQLGILYFGINILRTMATLYEAIHHDSLEKEIEADYRQKIFFKLQELKQSEIDTIKVGEILENIINDTKLFSKYYTYGVARSYFGGILRLIGILAVLLYLNVPIVMITFFIYIVGFIVTYFFNKKSIGYTKLKKDANAKILNWSNEQIEGYQTIKALEIEEQRLRQIKQLINDYEKSVNKLEKNIRTYTGIYEFLVSLVGIVNILIGSISLEQGILSYGSLVILVRYIDQPEVYARWFIEGFQMRNMSKISYSRIEKILQKEEESIDRGKELSKVEKIECKNISFTYSNNQKVLENISFVAKKNEKIALIGRTGSGKTTLVNLISRFYDLQKGEIKINGEDYQKYSIRSLRDKIGYIMQKVVIFNGTILENINYVNKDIAKDQIIEICKKLALHEKIMSFENGYETIIKPDTDLFSTGEKQLLNFSRVMVENPEIIILDEATASLSYQSEMLIRKAIEEITKEKISFIIAHRLATIKNCDKILLMKNGKILEEGKHDELMKKQGEYYNLVQ